MTKFLNHTRIKTVVEENGNIGKWEISGRITDNPHKKIPAPDDHSIQGDMIYDVQ